MTPNQQIARYLSHFESSLQPATKQERDDIMKELEAHIRDSMQESQENAVAVLERLGEPEGLARQFRESMLLHRAARSISPVILLRAALRLATKGIFGMIVLFSGLFGYAFGVGFVLVGLIKPLAPVHTGLWLQNGQMVSSGALVVVPPPPAHEVLGWWLIPIALVLGSVILLLTTITIKQSLKLSRAWQDVLELRPAIRHA